MTSHVTFRSFREILGNLSDITIMGVAALGTFHVFSCFFMFFPDSAFAIGKASAAMTRGHV
jgi:hypothetical protein